MCTKLQKVLRERILYEKKTEVCFWTKKKYEIRKCVFVKEKRRAILSSSSCTEVV